MTRMPDIAAEAEIAARRNGNGNGRRPPAAARIEAAGAAMAAAGAALGELFANRLIACLDAEGLGAGLSDGDLSAVLTVIRSLESAAPPPLPRRDPGATGPQAAVRSM